MTIRLIGFDLPIRNIHAPQEIKERRLADGTVLKLHGPGCLSHVHLAPGQSFADSTLRERMQNWLSDRKRRPPRRGPLAWAYRILGRLEARALDAAIAAGRAAERRDTRLARAGEWR